MPFLYSPRGKYGKYFTYHPRLHKQQDQFSNPDPSQLRSIAGKLKGEEGRGVVSNGPYVGREDVVEDVKVSGGEGLRKTGGVVSRSASEKGYWARGSNGRQLSGDSTHQEQLQLRPPRASPSHGGGSSGITTGRYANEEVGRAYRPRSNSDHMMSVTGKPHTQQTNHTPHHHGSGDRTWRNLNSSSSETSLPTAALFSASLGRGSFEEEAEEML